MKVFPKDPNMHLYNKQKEKENLKSYTSHGLPCDSTCTLICNMTN
jgi:hypothetical protein